MQGKNKDEEGAPLPPVRFSDEDRAKQNAALEAGVAHRGHDPDLCPHAADGWVTRWPQIFAGRLTAKVIEQADVALAAAELCEWKPPMNHAARTRREMAAVLGTGPAAGTVGELVKQIAAKEAR